MKKKFLHLILASGLVFSLTACQKDALESTFPESEASQQTEETTQTIEKETEVSNPAEENSQEKEAETESETASPEKEVKNEFFSVVYDSFSENEDFYVFTFIFTNISDMAYYKGDELYQPGEFWERKIRIPKDKIEDHCKHTQYVHYKLYDLSVYDENAQELFAGGVSFKLNEDLEVHNLEVFVDIPIERNS